MWRSCKVAGASRKRHTNATALTIVVHESLSAEQMVEAHDNRSLHIGSGHGWMLSREADLVPYFQRLSISHSSSHPGQIHLTFSPQQDLLSGHPNLQDQGSFSSDKGEVTVRVPCN